MKGGIGHSIAASLVNVRHRLHMADLFTVIQDQLLLNNIGNNAL